MIKFGKKEGVDMKKLLLIFMLVLGTVTFANRSVQTRMRILNDKNRKPKHGFQHMDMLQQEQVQNRHIRITRMEKLMFQKRMSILEEIKRKIQEKIVVQAIIRKIQTSSKKKMQQQKKL